MAHIKDTAMKRFRILLAAVLASLLFCGVATAAEHLRLATTTSTENSGLLAVLLPPFEKANDCKVDVIAVGTGKAIKLGETGDVDVILVHARAREEKFVAEGYGVNRRDVMYNDFVILGPAEDPAGIKGLADGAEALKKIAAAQATFVSRGDDSGTHTKEKSLWKKVDITPEGQWYLEAGRGMGEVITMATERRGYTLADRGTFIAYKSKTDLQVLTEGDKALFNPYGVIPVNPKKHPHVKIDLAEAFVAYLTGAEGQSIIANYRKNGEPLFFLYK
ncbi:ABC-type tungstate transport system, permease component [Desulfuromonas soudanensis]|uniref:ABC-type tungstate transport system, permease component n=2 Tax=Desulfuromonas soudanensis TaxID=1603606 RepID=A0A0M4DGQ4_9BACT|nr:ABC-type tungstate transport system, permease component [Desulfuromonas soudanensis]